MKIEKVMLISAAALLAPFAINAQAAASAVPENAKEANGVSFDAKKAKITVSGYAQAQYIYADSKTNSGDAYSGFAIRRAAISAKGEIDENWSAEVGFEIDGNNKNDKLNNAFVDKAIISYKTDFGKLTAGYQKTAFVMEEYTSSKTALCIEQSIASSWFGKMAGVSQLSGRHGGVWWDGKVEGVKYTLGVVNQYKEDFYADENRGVAFAGTLAYTIKADDGTALELGVNGIYNSGNDSKDESGNYVAEKAPHGAVWGVEPYAKLTVDGFTGIVDVLYGDGDKEAGVKDAAWGVNATAAYRFENDLEPVVRFSYVDTGDNKGLKPDLLKNVPKGTSDHDSAWGAYIGANFYANKHIKVSAGYEYTKFEGGAKSEDANAFRVQLQAVF